MNFLKDVVGFIMLLVICAFAICFVIGPLVALNAWFSKAECTNLGEVTKRKTDFRWIGGCYVEHEGEMLPYDKWKLLDVRVTAR